MERRSKMLLASFLLLLLIAVAFSFYRNMILHNYVVYEEWFPITEEAKQ